jgi:hypothetical protein
MWNAIKKTVNTVVETIKTVATKIKDFVKKLFAKATEATTLTVLAGSTILLFAAFAPEFTIVVILLVAFYLSVFYLMDLAVRTAQD